MMVAPRNPGRDLVPPGILCTRNIAIAGGRAIAEPGSDYAALAAESRLRTKPGENDAVNVPAQPYRTANRVVVAGISVSALLAASNIVVGLLTRSTSVVATGFEFAGDVL